MENKEISTEEIFSKRQSKMEEENGNFHNICMFYAFDTFPRTVFLPFSTFEADEFDTKSTKS
jgi:hypothetical protein